jgi:hypothetical protein
MHHASQSHQMPACLSQQRSWRWGWRRNMFLYFYRWFRLGFWLWSFYRFHTHFDTFSLSRLAVFSTHRPPHGLRFFSFGFNWLYCSSCFYRSFHRSFSSSRRLLGSITHLRHFTISQEFFLKSAKSPTKTQSMVRRKDMFGTMFNRL